MKTRDRLDQMVTLINQRGFVSVKDLRQIYEVTEMTIRRDLERLNEAGRIRRIFGGAVAIQEEALPLPDTPEKNTGDHSEGLLPGRADVMIVASHNSRLEGLLPESVKKSIPIVAESQPVDGTVTCVAVDNFQAGQALGLWAAQYIKDCFAGKAQVLDLTYHLPNTQARSRGFWEGLHGQLPEARLVLSLDAQSRYATAYQLTRDAMVVHPYVNVIFCVNDTMAWGAINACHDLRIPPDQVIIVPFGLEGERLKNALIEGDYVKGGLAMFPEIVGPACVEAAIKAYNHQPLPPALVTPYAVLTAANLDEFYVHTQNTWQLLKEAYTMRLFVPIDIDPDQPRHAATTLPGWVGLVIPFREHEWYQKMVLAMRAHARHLKIGFGVVDAEKSIKEELDQYQHQIARAGVAEIQPGDVVILDGGPITEMMAGHLLESAGITVITNSATIFNVLRANSRISLISTGGILRSSSQLLVGPMAETTLRELRADKLFLCVNGITLAFGLSHTNVSEVTIKQTMIRSAREVILVADHTCFGQESVSQVAPCTAVHKIITDDALSASFRLDLGKLGIDVNLVRIE